MYPGTLFKYLTFLEVTLIDGANIMNIDKFYAIRVSFHPDPKVEEKKQFSTRSDALQHINSFRFPGNYWMLLKENNNTYEFVKGFKYK